jgi:beta-glucosidase
VTPVDGVLSYDEGLFIGYRAYDRDGREPLFAFGHGLGYTTWSYESMSVDVDNVSVTLINTGERPGRSVVQVYASRPSSAVERPVKWLAGFAIAEAEPAAAVTVSVSLAARAFQHWAPGEGWVTEPGQFVLAAGPSSADLPLSGVLDIS